MGHQRLRMEYQNAMPVEFKIEVSFSSSTYTCACLNFLEKWTSSTATVLFGSIVSFRVKTGLPASNEHVHWGAVGASHDTSGQLN